MVQHGGDIPRAIGKIERLYRVGLPVPAHVGHNQEEPVLG
jgi:hypothetical protein